MPEKKPKLGKWRICAICLEDIPRAVYDQHLELVHGYQPLDTSPLVEGE